MGMTPLARFAAKVVAVMITCVVLVLLGLSAGAENQPPESFSDTLFTGVGIAGVVLMWFAYFFGTGGDNRRLAGIFLLGATIALAVGAGALSN
jgi:hypothetical protein